VERPQVALKFSGRPVYNNKVFTDGFTYYLNWRGDSASLFGSPAAARRFGDDLTQAFGIGVMKWLSALGQIRPELDSTVAAYLDALTSTSPRYRLMRAPTVLRVDCRRNATFIISVYGPGGQPYPRDGNGIVAEAALPGRTILINTRDRIFKFDLVQRTFSSNANRTINLDALMTHELGHAFGLEHVRADSSIMGERPRAGAPQKADARLLLQTLRKQIIGAAPGEFSAVRCGGVVLPVGLLDGQ
jgi:hypothetical protein